MKARRIAVLGGGISGLACANRLLELSEERKSPLQVTLIESSSRLGGTISTVSRNGCILEEGPDCFITDKPAALELCRRLGLETALIPTNGRFRKSFVLWEGKLHPTPEGFYLLAPGQWRSFLSSGLFSWPGKLRMALEYVTPRRPPASDESLAQFVRRRFGQEALARMAAPMVAGVYNADPETLSLRATFPRFLQMEENFGSVIRGLRAQRRARGHNGAAAAGPRYGLFVSLKEGMGQMIAALKKRLMEKGAEVRAGAAVEALARQGGGWRVSAAGESWDVDGVACALPAFTAAALLKKDFADLSSGLNSIPYRGAGTLTLAYRAAQAGRFPAGFGFVCPSTEKVSFVGCTFSHLKFEGRAPEDVALVRVFLGEDRLPGLFELGEETLAEKIHGELSPLLGLKDRPLFHHLARYPRAMPQFTLGHLDRAGAIEKKCAAAPRLALAGNYLRGVGIPDCVASGEAAAAAIFSAAAS